MIRGNKIEFDPDDMESMKKLMDTEDIVGKMFCGENEYGESILIEVSADPKSIVVTTYQNNGWERVNAYYYDGTREELFGDSKWK